MEQLEYRQPKLAHILDWRKERKANLIWSGGCSWVTWHKSRENKCRTCLKADQDWLMARGEPDLERASPVFLKNMASLVLRSNGVAISFATLWGFPLSWLPMELHNLCYTKSRKKSQNRASSEMLQSWVRLCSWRVKLSCLEKKIKSWVEKRQIPSENGSWSHQNVRDLIRSPSRRSSVDQLQITIILPSPSRL